MNITIKNKNQSFECRDGESILDAGLRQGITMPYGCRGGRCGNCMGNVIDGDFKYPKGQPEGISDEEARMGKALFCQAHAQSDMTIDVKIIDTPKGIEPRKMPARVHSLEKLADRFFEHPQFVLVITNMNYGEAPNLKPRPSVAKNLRWYDVALEGSTSHEFCRQLRGLYPLIAEGWKIRISEKTGFTLFFFTLGYFVAKFHRYLNNQLINRLIRQIKKSVYTD